MTKAAATRRTRRTTRASATASAAAPSPADMSPGAPFPASRILRPVPHLAARSALAGAAFILPPLDAAWPPESPRRRSPVRRRLAALVAAALVVAAVAATVAGTRVVLARLVDAAPVTSNTFAAGTWVTATTWYLHNNPTPPIGNTAAQFNLSLDTTAPTAGTLFNYDTGCESRIGRSINRNTGLVSEAGACRYATWRSTALAAARTLNGTATLTVFARKVTAGGTAPTLRAFLRIFKPSTSAYTELGTANATITTDPTLAFASYALTWSLASITVPLGSQVEVKIVSTGGTVQPEISYDIMTNGSSLALP